MFHEFGTPKISFQFFNDLTEFFDYLSRIYKFLKFSTLFAASLFLLEVEEAKFDVWERKEEAEEAEERLKRQEAMVLVAAGVGVGVGAGANERKHK